MPYRKTRGEKCLKTGMHCHQNHHQQQQQQQQLTTATLLLTTTVRVCWALTLHPLLPSST